MLPWLITLPFAAILFGTFFMLTHGLSPLGNRISITNKKSKLFIYVIILVTLLCFASNFTGLLSEAPESVLIGFYILNAILALISTECSYFLGKTKKWNFALMGVSALLGVFYFEIPLIWLLFISSGH